VKTPLHTNPIKSPRKDDLRHPLTKLKRNKIYRERFASSFDADPPYTSKKCGTKKQKRSQSQHTPLVMPEYPERVKAKLYRPKKSSTLARKIARKASAACELRALERSSIEHYDQLCRRGGDAADGDSDGLINSCVQVHVVRQSGTFWALGPEVQRQIRRISQIFSRLPR
jgi:hypothetical protein